MAETITIGRIPVAEKIGDDLIAMQKELDRLRLENAGLKQYLDDANAHIDTLQKKLDSKK